MRVCVCVCVCVCVSMVSVCVSMSTHVSGLSKKFNLSRVGELGVKVRKRLGPIVDLGRLSQCVMLMSVL